jgi:PAS domain S-box-containing protein
MEQTNTGGAAERVDAADARELWRLIDNSPLGIIAVDLQRRIVRCNRRATEILKYQPEELEGRPVEMLYDDPREPRRIGKQLHESPKGKVDRYESFVRSGERELIPIRITASWLYGDGGERTGSVSYFEDLRPVRKGERRLSTLLKENNLISQTGKLEETLPIWAEMMVMLLNTTFCRIFLLDQTEQFLVAKAAYPIPRSGKGLEWKQGLGEKIAVADWPQMIGGLPGGPPQVVSLERPDGQQLLNEWSRRLGLKNDIQSMLVIPLRTKNRLLGLLHLGELRGPRRAAFSEEKKELAMAIANQIAVSVDHTHLYAITERQRRLLATLIEKSLQLRSDHDSKTLLQRFVRDAIDLVSFTSGALFTVDPQTGELVLDVVEGVPPEMLGRRVAPGEGLAGAAALGDRPVINHNYSEWPARESVFEDSGFRSAVAVSLRDGDEVAGVLFLADGEAGSRMVEGDLEILAQFAAHASLAWRTSQLVRSEQQRLAQLINLSNMSGYIESAKDVNVILRVLLTGITAGYALGFNRAAVLMLNDSRTQLVGHTGVGYLSESEAHQDWERLYHLGLDNFSEFLRLLEREALPLTPVDEKVRGLRIPLRTEGEDDADLFSRAVSRQTHFIVDTPEALEQLPRNFREVIEPAVPAVIVPLVARQEVLGLLFADTKFTQAPITHEVVESLLRFVGTVALNVDNVALLKQTSARRDGLQQLWDLTDASPKFESPRQVLQYIVEQMLAIAEASWVRLILVDPLGQKRSHIDWIAQASGDRVIPPVSDIRPDGISMDVLERGEPFVVDDTEKQAGVVSATSLREGSKALACLPFYVQGQVLGVVWMHYEAPRKFYSFEVSGWQRYLNFAAGLYAIARRRERLDNLSRLHEAADALAAATTPRAVLDQIVRSARDVLRADYIIPWVYDPEQDRFVPESSTVASIPEELWREWRKKIPRKGGTADSIMRAGWVGIHDLKDPEQNRPIQEATLQFISSPIIGASSFQGIALAAGREQLGVLYAIYKEPQSFGEDERETATAFANHVTLALKKAQVMEQLTNAIEAASMVAKMTVLGDRKKTLKSIAKQVISVVRCDVVVLFLYDKTTKKLEHPPTMMGVKYKKRASRLDEVQPDSIVYEILQMDAPYLASNVPEDVLFKGKRFAEHEAIKSCVAVPLRVEGRSNGQAGSEVGVLFINYRKPHRFTEGELKFIELFSNQSAIAIHNMQLYEDRARGLSEQKALVELSGKMLCTNNSHETLKHAVSVCARQLNVEFCSIVLPERDGRLIIRASTGFGPGVEGTEVTERDALVDVWATMGDGRERVIYDYGESGQRVPPLVSKYAITSGACVPVFRGGDNTGKVIGALLVQTSAAKPRHFSPDEVDFLKLLANQTAIAYRSAERFEKVEQSRAYLKALYRASNALNACFGPGMDLRKVCTPIVQSARYITGLEGPPAVLATIHLLDEEANDLELVSVFPFDEHPRIIGRFGQRLSLDPQRAPGGRIGIVGRVIEEGIEQLVPDVSQERDYYLPFHLDTKSELAVPLLDQTKVIGVLNVESNQLAAFNEDDVEAMRALAELAVIGIENVRTYNAWRRGTRVADAFAQIGQTINDVNLDLKTTLKKVLKSIKDSLIDYTAAEVCRGDLSKGVAEVIESHGDQRYTEKAGRVYKMGEGYTGWIAKHQTPLLISDTHLQKEPTPKVTDLKLPIRSFVGVPLRINEREFGTLELVSHLPDAFDKWDQHLLQCVRDLAEVAIRNAEQAKELQSEAYVAGLGAWGAEVAHYVNTEVGLINIILNDLSDRHDLPEDVKEQLREAQSYAEALFYTREQDLSEVAEMDSIVEDRIDEMEKNCDRVTWRRDLNAAGCKVKISEWALRDITAHLLENAAKYAPPEKLDVEVVVRTWCEGEAAYLRVEDTGNGFPKEIEPMVFFQPIKKVGREGTGLMLVRSMVKRYGGAVTLYNFPDRGAHVEVSLHLDEGV